MRLTFEIAMKARPLIRPFIISTGARTHQDIIQVKLSGGGVFGYGETPGVAYKGDRPAQILAQLEGVRADVEAGITREDLLERLPACAARAVLDAALWDLSAKLLGVSAADQLSITPTPIASAFTIVLDAPEAMAEQARGEAWRPLLKVKLGGSPDLESDRMRAVRAAAPNTRCVIDANAGWTADQLRMLAPLAADLNYELLEQPLQRDSEDDPEHAAALKTARAHLPLFVDESFQELSDLDRLAPHYDGVNIKLDKCGGLTAALAIDKAARARGLKIFVGCMLAPTRAMAPAHLLAQRADYADLDGPFWFPDEPAKLNEHGFFMPVDPSVWGGT